MYANLAWACFKCEYRYYHAYLCMHNDPAILIAPSSPPPSLDSLPPPTLFPHSSPITHSCLPPSLTSFLPPPSLFTSLLPSPSHHPILVPSSLPPFSAGSPHLLSLCLPSNLHQYLGSSSLPSLVLCHSLSLPFSVVPLSIRIPP